LTLTKKRILVTGACGTIGTELVAQLIESHKIGELVALDNNESKLFLLEERFAHYPEAGFFLADVRDQAKLSRQMRGIDLVFHTAAFKHVLACEKSPFEAVQTNILGVQNIIQAATEQNVGRVIFTSSDKAVNPTNVMGTSKLMGERLITAANCNLRGRSGPIFSSTRFGNVLGSSGSVVSVFHEQIRKGGPVTLTDAGMTRFVMSIREAVQLVLDSAEIACGGEVFITKMPVVRIVDLARVLIRELAGLYGHDPEKIDIKTIGVKPGEKMYEELMNVEETRRTWELERYYVTLPAFKNIYRNIHYDYEGIVSRVIKDPYHSGREQPLSEKALTEFLRRNHLLEAAGPA
jgi:FlaA1/EpsC-like NDP-sugar epimerase